MLAKGPATLDKSETPSYARPHFAASRLMRSSLSLSLFSARVISRSYCVVPLA
jgi:hypothetical protein